MPKRLLKYSSVATLDTCLGCNLNDWKVILQNPYLAPLLQRLNRNDVINGQLLIDPVTEIVISSL
jgi:hypothetical protein